ncbi:cupin domain-containing protein [Nakamurella sp.]|uniref:cupin domain-containing protein n=1 Tax=Nakamurella sp. TaxID=1869182 RepID=UPI003B3B01DD
MGSTRYSRSPRDLDTLQTSLRTASTALRAEQVDLPDHRYLNDLIPKPWGHEFRVYSDDLYDVWKLRLDPGEATSTHCHPRKLTALLCLAGSAHLGTLQGAQTVSAGDLVILEPGVFHGTRNAGDGALDLIEVEVPRNKLDLVRSHDRYGRTGTQYETERLASIPELQASALIPGGRLRKNASLDGFEFTIRAGLDLVSRPCLELAFAVSLDIATALNHTVVVLPGWLVPTAAEHDGLYLTITRSRADQAPGHRDLSTSSAIGGNP